MVGSMRWETSRRVQTDFYIGPIRTFRVYRVGMRNHEPASTLTAEQRAAMDNAWRATTPDELASARAEMRSASVPETWVALAVEAYRRRLLESYVLARDARRHDEPTLDRIA